MAVILQKPMFKGRAQADYQRSLRQPTQYYVEQQFKSSLAQANAKVARPLEEHLQEGRGPEAELWLFGSCAGPPCWACLAHAHFR